MRFFRPRPAIPRPETQLRLFIPPFLKRRTRTENEAIIRALCATAYLGDSTSVCRVLGRFKLFVDTQDIGISTHLMLDGYWEMWLTEVLAETVKPGMTVVDVGANLGYFSIMLADLVGWHGQVHCFEPNPALAGRLRKSVRANGYEAIVTVNETALGDTDGATFELVVPEDDPKNGVMRPAPNACPGTPNIVTTQRLDSFFELHGADLIKIDADTAEQMIWRGMRGIFDQQRPLIIFLEFNAARYRDATGFLAEVLEEGFTLARVDLADGIVPCSVIDILRLPVAEDQMLLLRR